MIHRSLKDVSLQLFFGCKMKITINFGQKKKRKCIELNDQKSQV